MPQRTPNTQPIFFRNPVIRSAILQTEVTDRNPNQATVPKTIIVGEDPATIIESIEVNATGIMTATVLRFYLYSVIDTASKNILLREILMPAVTADAIADQITPNTNYPLLISLVNTLSPASPNPNVPNQCLRLPEGFELRAGLGAAITNPIVVNVFGGTY